MGRKSINDFLEGTLNNNLLRAYLRNGFIVDLNLRATGRNNVSIIAASHQQPIKEYHFVSKKEGSPLGFEIIKSAMTAWAVSDLACSDLINVHYGLTSPSRDYIKEIYNLVNALFSKIDPKIRISEINFMKEDSLPTKIDNISKDWVFLGRSGGKDSLLVEKVLQREGNLKLVPFKINYDALLRNEFSIFEDIKQEAIYSLINPQLNLRCKNKLAFFLSPQILALQYYLHYLMLQNSIQTKSH